MRPIFQVGIPVSHVLWGLYTLLWGEPADFGGLCGALAADFKEIPADNSLFKPSAGDHTGDAVGGDFFP